jgi:ATP-binding cassette subfamily F protein 3
LIQFRRLALARGARRLFADANLQIHPGSRVGVVGPNGSGKSSLFALLRGELQPEAGECSRPADWRIASVNQETPALPRPALEYVLDGDSELRATEQALLAAETNGDGHAIAELHARLAAIDGYAARARAAELLDGLGFAPGDLERPVADFSGGWRMRLNLARALISRAQLLLLDEPTNHLDLDAVVWLERWLAGFRGTLLLVSHDRDFLDGCVTQVLSFERELLQLYAGNYSAYELQRAERLAVQQAMFERQQRELAHIHRFVERFRAKASKARQVQSRLKALDRMEQIAAAHVDTPFDFEFPEPARAPDPLLVIEDGAAGYGDRPVLRELRLSLRPGSRLGLLGPNGAGKSTLVKLLAGEIEPLAGQRVAGYGLAIGYFAQHQLEQLRPADSPLQHLLRVDPQARELDLRKYLGSFDFRGAMADAPVGPLSGGEKSRLALALLVRTRPNLLLLDEPTNHLDLEMRHALTRALAEYDGSLVLVSHDRALLRTICDGFVLVADGAARDFDGDLDDYMGWLEQRRQQRRAAETGAGRDSDKAQRLEQRSAAAADRQQRLARRRPLQKEITRLERDLATWQAERTRLDALLGDPDFYVREPPAAVERCARDRAALESRIDSAESRWLEVQAELEEVGAD